MYVQLHIPAGKPEQQVEAAQLEDLLLSKLPQQTLQGFDGNEVRPEAWVLYFESGSPLKLLARVAEILQTAGKELSGFQAVIIDSGEREADGVRVSLDEMPERLPQRKRQRKPKVFDYFAVPLPGGRFGHVQYAARIEPAGDFVVALDLVSERHAVLDTLIAAPIRFGPVPI